MGIREDLVEEYGDADLLFMDGYDDAIIGVCTQYGRELVVAYSHEKVLEMSVKTGSTYEEAIEFFEYNQVGAYMGEKTPVFIRLLNDGK